MLPGITRTDQKAKEDPNYKDVAQAIDEALKLGPKEYKNALKEKSVFHLGVYIRFQSFKIYLSASKSRIMAMYFCAVSGGALSKGYCYALRCRNGFELPSSGPDFLKEHTFLKYAEQEVAVPGAIWWEDVVGFRAVRIKDDNQQFLFGPVFLQNRLLKMDRRAFYALFRLLGGEAQGSYSTITKTYPTEPWL